MNLYKYFIILLVPLMAIQVETYSILGFFPLSFRSHNIFFEALMKGLAKRGHQVEVITHHTLENPPQTYKTILNLNNVKFFHPVKKLQSIRDNETISFRDPVLLAIEEYGNRICELFATEKIKKLLKDLLKDKKYDLIITEGLGISCFYVLGHLFNVPLAIAVPSLELPWISRSVGNPASTAFYPTFTMMKAEIKTFWDRLVNTIQCHLSINRFLVLSGKNQSNQLQEYFGQNIPTVRELERNVALSLVNTHYTLQGLRPTTPAFIEVGGLHIEEDDSKLTMELKQWMDDSKDGVLYFSLGTSVPIEILSKETISSLFASFARLAPFRILMKITEELEISDKVPKNVLLKTWIPQIAVLSHNNTKAFVTQGGALSIQEAIHCAVPIIGIPVFFDQQQNVKIIVKKNMGLYLDFREITGPSLEKALRTLLNDSKYRNAAKYHSHLFRDRIMSPLDMAAFWIEYTIRNGPEVLRSPAIELYWWQVDLLDVYGFLLFFSLLILYGILLIGKVTHQWIFRKRIKLNLKTD